jgi:hypothetical protein
MQGPPPDPGYRVRYLKAKTAVEDFRTASRQHAHQMDQRDLRIRWLEGRITELTLDLTQSRPPPSK